ncbi:MAG: hypothetical protein WAJ87_02550, partial [Bryobacteraceae bacterium]
MNLIASAAAPRIKKAMSHMCRLTLLPPRNPRTTTTLAAVSSTLRHTKMRFRPASSAFSASVSGRRSLSPTAPIPFIQNFGACIVRSSEEEARTILSVGHNHTPPAEK